MDTYTRALTEYSGFAMGRSAIPSVAKNSERVIKHAL